jgi:hypothetical protein
LIAKWDQANGKLGPCPMVKLGEFGGTMSLRFTPKTLVGCERSAQLQKVGELCNDGVVRVSCPGGTIIYGVDPAAADTPAYNLEQLTVVDPASVPTVCPPELACTEGDYVGPAGHVLLSYPSGGAILASAGHWKSLMSFDVTEEQVMAVAVEAYGAAYSSMVSSELEMCGNDLEQRKQVSSKWAGQFVQQSAPCKQSKSKRSAVTT